LACKKINKTLTNFKNNKSTKYSNYLFLKDVLVSIDSQVFSVALIAVVAEKLLFLYIYIHRLTAFASFSLRFYTGISHASPGLKIKKI